MAALFGEKTPAHEAPLCLKCHVHPDYEHARPNACWQSDLSDGLWLPDPTDPARHRKCYLHAFIDDHSRLIPHAAFYWRESLPALEDCFRQAIASVTGQG